MISYQIGRIRQNTPIPKEQHWINGRGSFCGGILNTKKILRWCGQTKMGGICHQRPTKRHAGQWNSRTVWSCHYERARPSFTTLWRPGPNRRSSSIVQPLSNIIQIGVDMANEIYPKGVLPETGFVRLPLILHILPISKSTWWNGVASGRFPKPVKLGPPPLKVMTPKTSRSNRQRSRLILGEESPKEDYNFGILIPIISNHGSTVGSNGQQENQEPGTFLMMWQTIIANKLLPNNDWWRHPGKWPGSKPEKITIFWTVKPWMQRQRQSGRFTPCERLKRALQKGKNRNGE